MVVKLADLGINMEEEQQKPRRKGGKRKGKGVEKQEAQAKPDNQDQQLEQDPGESEEPKKAKLEVDPAVVELMEKADTILTDAKSNLQVRIDVMSELFEAILDKNVNTVLLRQDFANWVKLGLEGVLQKVKSVSTKLFKMMDLGLKVAPTVFEAILDSVLSISLFKVREGQEVQDSCDMFMESLLNTFDKLRRFAKFIAKLLVCARENLNPEDVNGGGDQPLSPKVLEAIGPIISLLMAGQITDLWKVLLHNLQMECIKHIIDDTKNQGDLKTRVFLHIVTDVMIEFLSNIRVTDFTIPRTTVDKVSELMGKLKDDVLKPLGEVLSKQKKPNPELVQAFLKLAYAYGQLHGMLIHYNSKYDKSVLPLVDKITPYSDLCVLHEYLTAESWSNIFSRTLQGEDSSFTALLVKLVAQKLSFIASLHSDSESAVARSKECAEFLWIHLSKDNVKLPQEVVNIVTQYVEPRKVMELASSIIQHQSQPQNAANHSKLHTVFTTTPNPMFQYALILETIREIMRRLQKMKLLSMPIKEILNNVLSLDNRTALILEESASFMKLKPGHHQGKKKSVIIMEGLRDSVNSLLEKNSVTKPTKRESAEFSSDLIDNLLQLLFDLDLESYPKDVKTIVFLCSMVILFALLEQELDTTMLQKTAKIIAITGSHSQGNQVLFALNWVKFFNWFTANFDNLSADAQTELGNMILGNIYMSPKILNEFEENESNGVSVLQGQDACEGVRLIILEFLLKELQATNAKIKTASQVRNHCRTSAKLLVRLNKSDDDATLPNFFKTCWLLHLSMDVMDKDTTTIYKKAVRFNIKRSLKFIKSMDSHHQELSATYILKFLHSVAKTHSKVQDMLPKNCLIKIWKSCFQPKILQYSVPLSTKRQADQSIMPKHFVKDTLEAASNANLEFQEICDIIVQKAELFITNPQKYEEISIIFHVLAELVDAKLISPECKAIRRQTLQLCLEKILMLSLHWDPSDSRCLSNVIVPCFQFQTKLLRRRGAMVNLKTLAMYLTFVPSATLTPIQDATNFRIAFTTLSELLNAFALHRLDVIGFRSHVYLQGFQHLLECLMKRADQKNKLSEGEILQLRTCAHGMERICQSMKMGSREFARVAPYFIATLVRHFESVTVYPAVKIPILGGCYKLLDLCDQHGIAQLNSLLTVGSREIFKSIYEQYQKYYKYKGRV